MPKKIKIFKIFILLIFCYKPCFCLEINPDEQLNLANSYFTQKDFFRAITEYERFAYFFQNDKRADFAVFQVGMSYFYLNRPNEAIKNFKIIIEKHKKANGNLNILTSAFFMTSKAYKQSGAFQNAISCLEDFKNFITNLKNLDLLNLLDRINYEMGLICLEFGKWENAQNYFDKLTQENKKKFKLEKISSELNQEKSSQKSPNLAGILSAIIPGAGYLYCERYHDALISLLVNSLMIYASYESFEKKINTVGLILLTFESGFYLGNIYGSVNAVEKYNKKKIMDFINSKPQFENFK